MSPNLQKLVTALHSQANPQKAKDLQWFFKTEPGEYAEGDKFLGIMVPHQRRLSRLYWDTLSLKDVEELLHSPFHEFRLTALMILVKHFSQNPEAVKNLYLSNTKYMNNWDLVDSSCHKILGVYCYEHNNYSILTKLSRSANLWEKRIAMVSTAWYIKNLDFRPTLEIAKTLLNDPHDLIHKAVGWMLREVGNRDQKVLTDFLDEYTLRLPRTALRYAIEKFPSDLRLHYLKLK